MGLWSGSGSKRATPKQDDDDEQENPAMVKKSEREKCGRNGLRKKRVGDSQSGSLTELKSVWVPRPTLRSVSRGT